LRQGRRLRLAAAGLVMLAAVSACGGGDQHDDGFSTASRDAILEAAESGLTAVMGYDYRTLDADQADAHAHLTESMTKSYDTGFTKVRTDSTAQKSVLEARVRAVGIAGMTRDSAEVLGFVDQRITAGTVVKPVTPSRIRLTMVLQDGRWLISALDEKDPATIDEPDEARVAAMTAASRFYEVLETFTPKDVGRFFDRVVPLVAPDKVEGFRSVIASITFDRKMTSGARTTGAAVVGLEGKVAVVIVAGDRRTATGTKQTSYADRFRMAMVEVDGAWFVTDFDTFD